MNKEKISKIEDCLWHLEKTIGKSHDDYITEINIAYALDNFLEMEIRSFKDLWRKIKYHYKIKKAALLHQKCCGIDKKDW